MKAEYSNSEISAVIDEYVHKERDRAILKRRFCDGVYFEPLAEEFGLSVQRVKAIVKSEEKKVFKHLRD